MSLPFLHENQVSRLPPATNEPVLEYKPNSAERGLLQRALEEMRANPIDMPLVIDGEAVRTGQLDAAVIPHDHRQVLGHAHLAGDTEIANAVSAAIRAQKDWSRWPWTERAAIFLKAAELLSGKWRYVLNAATMLGQSKTVHQAEIDAAAEMIDFWRFNCQYLHDIYSDQPVSTSSTWNHVDYRPLEGFVLAITPFNFTSIAGNLPTAPALMGNTVLWKPSTTAKPAAHFIMELLREAGLPDGVINLVYGDAARISQLSISDSSFAGLHFTGSTDVFSGLLSQIAQNVGRYHSHPRVFAMDRSAVAKAASVLRNAAGNFYVNDKPTGAVVGQQPFGGGRASGTNDKAGSVWNLIRWTSPRSIKETFNAPVDYRYPSMA